MTQDDRYRRVQAQFGRTAAAYVSSSSHAKGAELEQMVALAGALHPASLQPGSLQPSSLRPGPLSGKTVLDVATGGGHTALAFARAGAQVTATDLTPEMLAAAEAFIRAEGFTEVAFAPAAAEALPFGAATFDLVTCRIAAHHFAEPVRFVEEAARVLRPGGLLLIVDNIAPEDPELGRLMNELERRRDPSHVQAYSVSQWVGWLTAAGLELQHLSRWYLDKPFGDWLARAQTPAADGERLAERVLALPAAQQAYFRVVVGESGLESLAHEAVLLIGKKPEQ